MSEQYDLDDVQSFTVGAIGEPGGRVFILQARQGAQTLTLKVEKQQVAMLIAYLAQLLHSVPLEGDAPEAAEIQEVEPDFVAGSIAVSYEEDPDRVVIAVEELVAEGEPASGARLLVSRPQAAGVVIEGKRLIESGRPPCPFCGYPLDRRGHVCPRTNGSHPPLT
jgi:uncharacterized repeat protein (TIGR03847 family)